MNSSANTMRIAPAPTAVAAEIVDFVNDIPGNDLITGFRFQWQIARGNEKIDGVTDNLETVFVDDFILSASEDGVDGISFFVATIDDFRRNMLFLFLRKPLKSGLQHVHIGYPIRTRTVPSVASAAWIARPSSLLPVAVVTACFAVASQ